MEQTRKAWRKLYGRRWRNARTAHLGRHPLCVFCEADGRTVPATVVDHIQPHRGDPGLFWDRSNWQSLCKRCHDGTKQSQETREARAPDQCNEDGTPADGSW